MEGFVSLLRNDQWQHISTFLTIRELCRLMCVSRGWFHFWVDDRYWLYQEQRVCFAFPSLKPLFEQKPSKETKKKRKTEWTMPRKGTWWVFKRWLHLGTNTHGFKELCKKEAMYPLVFAVASLNIPLRESITERKVIPNPRKGGPGYSMYRISFWTPAAVHPGNRMTFVVRHGCEDLDFEFYCIMSGRYHKDIVCNGNLRLFRTAAYFQSWKAFLFQQPCIPNWTDLFVNLIQNTITV